MSVKEKAGFPVVSRYKKLEFMVFTYKEAKKGQYIARKKYDMLNFFVFFRTICVKVGISH